MIVGPPTFGDVYVNDKRMTDVPVHRRNIGMLFQNYALFLHLTVEENITFGLEMRGISKADAARKVVEALDLVQLSSFGKRYPAQLSGGQQRCVALGRALVIGAGHAAARRAPRGARQSASREHAGRVARPPAPSRLTTHCPVHSMREGFQQIT